MMYDAGDLSLRFAITLLAFAFVLLKKFKFSHSSSPEPKAQKLSSKHGKEPSSVQLEYFLDQSASLNVYLKHLWGEGKCCI